MEKCKTLGEETYFEFTYLNNHLTITYGFTAAQQTTVDISNYLIATVIKRVDYLIKNEKENSRKTSYYSRTYWEECPQTQHCPYIAKLVLDVFPLETIEAILSQN